MLDITKQEIKVGDYIAYAKSQGRSSTLSIYHVREVIGSKIKVHELHGMDTWQYESKYRKYSLIIQDFVPLDAKERDKVDNKTVTLSMSNQAIILKDFDPVAHRFG